MNFSGECHMSVGYSHSCRWFNIICFKLPHMRSSFTWHSGCFTFYVLWQ